MKQKRPVKVFTVELLDTNPSMSHIVLRTKVKGRSPSEAFRKFEKKFPRVNLAETRISNPKYARYVLLTGKGKVI